MLAGQGYDHFACMSRCWNEPKSLDDNDEDLADQNLEAFDNDQADDDDVGEEFNFQGWWSTYSYLFNL